MEEHAKHEFAYRPHGVCARLISFDIDEDGAMHNVSFTGGCNGNAKGIAALVEGMDAEWVVERCKGTICANKGTSCPDQLAIAIEGALQER